MGYYIADDGVTVYRFRVARGPTGKEIRLEETGEVIIGDETRMFAVHPKDNKYCEMKNGIWHFAARPVIDK